MRKINTRASKRNDRSQVYCETLSYFPYLFNSQNMRSLAKYPFALVFTFANPASLLFKIFVRDLILSLFSGFQWKEEPRYLRIRSSVKSIIRKMISLFSFSKNDFFMLLVRLRPTPAYSNGYYPDFVSSEIFRTVIAKPMLFLLKWFVWSVFYYLFSDWVHLFLIQLLTAGSSDKQPERFSLFNSKCLDLWRIASFSDALVVKSSECVTYTFFKENLISCNMRIFEDFISVENVFLSNRKLHYFHD